MPGAGGQRREREIEVEEILPGHLDYREGQGRAFHVWTITRAGAGSKYGLGKLSEAQLRELGRQIGHLLRPAAGPEAGRGPDESRKDAAAGLLEGCSDVAGVLASREGTASGATAGA